MVESQSSGWRPDDLFCSHRAETVNRATAVSVFPWGHILVVCSAAFFFTPADNHERDILGLLSGVV